MRGGVFPGHFRGEVQKEEAQVGSVAADVYSTYIQAAGGWCLAITVLVGVLVGQGAATPPDAVVLGDVTGGQELGNARNQKRCELNG